MRERTLLLGNGLNRTLQNSLSWSDLMKQLGSTTNNEDEVPFPIDFEQIAANQGCMVGSRQNDAYKLLRGKMSDIVDRLNSATAGEVHQAFRNLGMSNVITTNYDSIFESMYDCKPILKQAGGYKNILTAISESSSIKFYHAHGLGKWKNTLCLSHEHYISLITKIRNLFFTDTNDENKERLTEIIKGEADSTETWPELLFTTDVAIVGLELDFSEIDFWWLLAQRAAIFAPCNHFDEYANSIDYYYINIDSETATKAHDGRMRALQSLGVNPHSIQASNYQEGYLDLAKLLGESWT